MLKNMKLAHRLLAAFLLVSTLPLILAGLAVHSRATQALSDQSFAQLTAIRAIKGEQIAQYFAGLTQDMEGLAEAMHAFRNKALNTFSAIQANRKGEVEGFFRQVVDDIGLFSEVTELKTLYQTLVDYHTKTGVTEDGAYQIDTPEYRELYRQYGGLVARLADRYGFDEVLMICSAHGHIMFSTARRDDLGTNLRFGPYKDSLLHKLWKKVVESGQPAIVDVEPYAANGGKPTAFIGAPLFVAGKMQGVIVVQIPLAQINRIMSAHSGLGESGESYLVGPDLLMRSDSRFDQTNRTLTASFANPAQGRTDTGPVRAALKGETGTGIARNYRGKEVLSAWAPLSVMDLNWAFVTEIDLDEAFNPKDETGKEYLQRFQELHGFYDVFLIDAGGFVFYTATKEAEYRTNILTGAFRTSNLGRLVAQVMKTGSGGFVDFEPYAPSGGKPYAFLAHPVKVGERVEMVVALQIPIEEIDKVMQQRAGMGRTGEIYLVGPDKRMRSDSYLDPQNHSIAASFAGTVERNGADTPSAREALDGKPGTRVTLNYKGDAVLSAYAPVSIGGGTWAVIAEMNAAEAFAAVSRLQWLMGAILLLVVAVNLGVSLWLARSITRPVTEAVALSSAVAEGRLDRHLASDRGDEVGQLIRCLDDMSTKLRRIVAQVRAATDQVVTAAGEIAKGNMDLSQRTEEQASSLEETAASMEELTSTVKQNAENAAQANRLATDARKQAEAGGSVAHQAMAAMTAINDSSKRIADIIGVIDEIAFQTNLLSLNAAVEAARAGEHGRGFAVVADEVRKLAQRSADAAKEIKSLITDSVHKVEDGGRLVSESGRMLTEIIGAVKQVSDIVAEISAASREQSVGIEQVNKAVMQMDEVTQQNASLVEEAAAAAASLEDQARQLQRSMAFFRIDADDERQPNPPRMHLPPPSPDPRVIRQAAMDRNKPGKGGKPASIAGDEWEEF